MRGKQDVPAHFAHGQMKAASRALHALVVPRWSRIQTADCSNAQRIVQDGIIFNFLDAEQKGLKEDIRIKKYAAVDKVTFADLNAIHANNLSGKPYTYAIEASEAKLKPEDLQKTGEFKKLTLEQIFGY